MGEPRVVVAAVETTSRLAVYTTGYLSVLAPRDWKCQGASGVNGSQSIAVFPQACTGPAGPFKLSSGQGVTAMSIPACQGCMAAVVCPLFPSVLRDWPGIRCDNVVPPGERVPRQNASTVFFEDPPGVSGDGNPSGGPYPAHGVLLFPPASGATCTLREADHALCTVVLNEFLAHR